MNLYTHCTSCKRNIKIKSQASTRPDLQMEKGEEFNVKCQNCGNEENKHVNDIKAESNNSVLFIGIGIGIFAMIFLWFFLGVFATLSAVIPLIFWQQQAIATKGFNSYLIRRK